MAYHAAYLQSYNPFLHFVVPTDKFLAQVNIKEIPLKFYSLMAQEFELTVIHTQNLSPHAHIKFTDINSP